LTSRSCADLFDREKQTLAGSRSWPTADIHHRQSANFGRTRAAGMWPLNRLRRADWPNSFDASYVCAGQKGQWRDQLDAVFGPRY
jgi:hypothetical protein